MEYPVQIFSQNRSDSCFQPCATNMITWFRNLKNDTERIFKNLHGTVLQESSMYLAILDEQRLKHQLINVWLGHFDSPVPCFSRGNNIPFSNCSSLLCENDLNDQETKEAKSSCRFSMFMANKNKGRWLLFSVLFPLRSATGLAWPDLT